MKFYESYLQKNDIKVKYIEFGKSDLKQVIRSLKEQKTEEIQVVDPTDFLLKKRIIRESEKNDITIGWLSNPNFMTTKNELKERLRKGKSGYFMANFYKKQRQEINILMDGDEPTGGKWSFDEENRKKLPKDIKIPKEVVPETNP